MNTEIVILIEKLKELWYSDKEIKKVVQGLMDKKNNKVFSAEEVYNRLLKKHESYA